MNTHLLLLFCAFPVLILLPGCKTAPNTTEQPSLEQIVDFIKSTDDSTRTTLFDSLMALKARDALNSPNKIIGSGIRGQVAVDMTSKYYGPDSSGHPDMFKSVHFDLDSSFFAFLAFVRELGSAGGGKPGLRVYLARSLSPHSTGSITNDYTVILRGTRNTLDIPHDPADEANGKFVAFNYGDPCPPRCKPGQNITAEECTGGKYTLQGGAYPDLNCRPIPK